MKTTIKHIKKNLSSTYKTMIETQHAYKEHQTYISNKNTSNYARTEEHHTQMQQKYFRF